MSDAPDGTVLYCNQKNTCVWGGDEARCSGFIVSDSTDAVQKDYSIIVSNTLSDANNLATLVSGTTTSTVAVKYWASGSWNAVAGFTDNTALEGLLALPDQ